MLMEPEFDFQELQFFKWHLIVTFFVESKLFTR